MNTFPQYTVIWTIFRNLVIHKSRNHDDEIVELSLIQTSWIISTINAIIPQVICYTTNKNVYWIINNLIENYQHAICEKTIYKVIYHLYIFAFVVCVELVTPASLWRHKGVAMHGASKTMHSLATMHDSSPSASEIHFIMYQMNQLNSCVHHFIRL